MYDASRGGLARLTLLEHARRKRSSARRIRAHANMHSPEEIRVVKSYKVAAEQEKEAEKLDAQAERYR